MKNDYKNDTKTILFYHRNIAKAFPFFFFFIIIAKALFFSMNSTHTQHQLQQPATFFFQTARKQTFFF
jgi:hypothetical protein